VGPSHVLFANVGDKFADVDTNYPIASRGLTFDIDIIEECDADAEDLAHGYDHGPDGRH